MPPWVWATAFCLLAAASAGCSNEPGPSDSADGKATVLANLTVEVRNVELMPVADAWVALEPGDGNVTTGPMGDVRLPALQPRAYWVTAHKHGYFPKSEEVELGRHDATVRVILAEVPAPEAHFELDDTRGYCMIVDGDQDPPSCTNLLFADKPEAVINITAWHLDRLWVHFVWDATSEATQRLRFDVEATVPGTNWTHTDAAAGPSDLTWVYDGLDLPPVNESGMLRVTFTPRPLDAPPGPTWADQHYRIDWVARYIPTDA